MNNFEHNIKDRLDNYNSEIDPYEIWDGIQAKRNKQKKRRWGLIWLAASILVIVSTILIISSRQSNSNNNIVKINKTDAKEVTSKNKQDQKDIIVIDKKDIQSDKFNSSTKSLVKTHIENLSTSNKHKANETIGDFSVKNNNKKEISKKGESKTSIVYNTDILSNKKSTDSSESKTIDNSSENLENSLTKSRELINISSLNYKWNELASNRKSLILHFKSVPFNSHKQNFFNKKPFPELSITGNYTHNQYSLNNSSSESFMSNVQDNEKQLESLDIFFGYNIPIYRGFGVFTGLNYGQVDSKLDFTFKDKKEIVIDSALTKIVYKSLTDTLRIYERAKTNATYEIHDVKYNYRRYIRVPVLLTFASSLKSLKYEIRIGADLNILTCNNAKAVTPEGKTVSIEDTELNLNKDKILGDFHFDFRLEFKINKNLAVLFGPQYKMSLSSLMQEKAGFNQYRHSIGVNIGAKYRYN